MSNGHVSEVWPSGTVLPPFVPLVDEGCPGDFPVPPGRDRWRFTLHNRQFSPSESPNDTIIAEITSARSRRIEQAINKAANLTFSIDGREPTAQLIQELTTDLFAWRWDDRTGHDVCVFRGIVAQSEDTLSEQADTINFTCHDYAAMLDRRIVTQGPWEFNNVDQDEIVRAMVETPMHNTPVPPAPTTYFAPGDFLPLHVAPLNEAGATRVPSGQIRIRSYEPGQSYLKAIDDLSAVINGFDYDVAPGARFGELIDRFRIFYPHQGVVRDDCPLVYGSTVSALTRSINSADYANFIRVSGSKPTTTDDQGNQTTNQDDPNMFSERWNNDALQGPIGLWMTADSASDVSIQQTLDDKAAGDLDRMGVIVPSYTITLTPGAYTWQHPNMGDEVSLVIQAGRLNVDTDVRVLGITYEIGDDGQETVGLTVGRPTTTLHDLFTQGQATLDALVRR